MPIFGSKKIKNSPDIRSGLFFKSSSRASRGERGDPLRDCFVALDRLGLLAMTMDDVS